VTPLGKKKKSKIQSTSNMGSKGDGREKSNLNQDNIIFPQSIGELPDELRQKL
jgi:hypothetical protein